MFVRKGFPSTNSRSPPTPTLLIFSLRARVREVAISFLPAAPTCELYALLAPEVGFSIAASVNADSLTVCGRPLPFVRV